MAGDWIKMRLDLATHPKVVRIMSATKSDRFRVVGGLHSVWAVFDQHTEDGTLFGYTPELMDITIGWDGFSNAMIGVGWLGYDGAETLTMPDFDNHNGKSARRRAEDSNRKRLQRNSDNSPQNVRKMSAGESDKSATREEKRREEKSSKDNVELAHDDVPATIPDSHYVIDYLNAKAGKQFKHTSSHCKHINGRLKEGRTVQDLIAVIDRKCAEWIGNPNMEQYLRPQTLFNSEKFDGYLSEIDKPLAAPKPSQFIPDHNDTSWADGFNPYAEVF